MDCIHGNNKCKPTYDAMVVHRDSYFYKTKENKERVCFNCIHWEKIYVAIGKCLNQSDFADFKNERVWYGHSCALCHLEIN